MGAIPVSLNTFDFTKRIQKRNYPQKNISLPHPNPTGWADGEPDRNRPTNLKTKSPDITPGTWHSQKEVTQKYFTTQKRKFTQMTTKLTVTRSLLPGRVSWSLDEPDTGVNICSGHCYKKNLEREVDEAVKSVMRCPSPAQDDAILYTNWVEIADAIQRATQLAVLVLAFIISTGYAQGTVNLRSCPSTECKVIATVHEGDVILPAPGPENTWRFAFTPQGQGWIYGDYIEAQP